MDFRLTDEQIDFQRHCHEFARDVVRPAAARYDREQAVPYDVVGEARARGLHGLDLLQRLASDPEGMLGVIYAEELHWGCAGIALALSVSSLAAAGVASSGTPEQIARWVPECFGVGEEIKFGAYAVTEAGAGSDVRSLRTTARREGDEWVLNGTKVFISNGGIADVTVVVATVDPKLGHRGQACRWERRRTSSASAPRRPPRWYSRMRASPSITCWEDCRSWKPSSSAPARATAAALPMRWPPSR